MIHLITVLLNPPAPFINSHILQSDILLYFAT
jgi:hypothetical protein